MNLNFVTDAKELAFYPNTDTFKMVYVLNVVEPKRYLLNKYGTYIRPDTV